MLFEVQFVGDVHLYVYLSFSALFALLMTTAFWAMDAEKSVERRLIEYFLVFMVLWVAFPVVVVVSAISAGLELSDVMDGDRQ